jgi:hypothetical protein
MAYCRKQKSCINLQFRNPEDENCQSCSSFKVRGHVSHKSSDKHIAFRAQSFKIVISRRNNNNFRTQITSISFCKCEDRLPLHWELSVLNFFTVQHHYRGQHRLCRRRGRREDNLDGGMKYRTGWSSGSTLGLYSGGARFDSWPGHRLTWGFSWLMVYQLMVYRGQSTQQTFNNNNNKTK